MTLVLQAAPMRFDIGLDLFPLLAATLAALCCGLLGNFLVLRRLSLMGDAISHSVLPGLVVAFLIASARSPGAMFLGAAAAGIVTVVLVELVKRFGRVEPGAAMGVIFTVLFALGVLLMEEAAARQVDLDAECVLHGQLETLVWYGAPDSIAGIFGWHALAAVPVQVTTLALLTVLSAAFILLLFKELRLAAFDPALATAQGFNATLLHCLLMVLVAAATVASFEAVGSILVVAMLICPAAAARLLTDRLGAQIVWSAAIALCCGVGGYVAATALPALAGKGAVNAAGMMAVVAGVILCAAIVASPDHGVVTRVLRRRRHATQVASDDVLAALYRGLEAGAVELPVEQLERALVGRPVARAVAGVLRQGLVARRGACIALTPAGRSEAALVVRRHRLWEQYLVAEAGLAPDHVHAPAERLEHLRLEPPARAPDDPHGRPIPGK